MCRLNDIEEQACYYLGQERALKILQLKMHINLSEDCKRRILYLLFFHIFVVKIFTL